MITINDFSNIVKFKVGQRVKINLPNVPEEQKDVTTGTIVGCEVSCPTIEEHRKIFYNVQLDNEGSYIKKEYKKFINLRHKICILQEYLIEI